MSDEKRTSPRIDAQLPVDISLDNESVALFKISSDISKAGVFVHTDDPLPVGSLIEVIFPIFGDDPEQATQELTVAGQVMQARIPNEGDDRPAGMGIKFIDIPDEIWSKIEKVARSGERPMEVGVITADTPADIQAQLEKLKVKKKND